MNAIFLGLGNHSSSGWQDRELDRQADPNNDKAHKAKQWGNKDAAFRPVKSVARLQNNNNSPVPRRKDFQRYST